MPQIIINPEPQPRKTLNAFDTRTDAVEAWIANLPLADVGETRGLVFNALAEMNAEDLPNRQRFKALELFRSPIKYLGDALERYFVGSSFPLSPKANRAATLLHDIQLETAKGYRCISDELLKVDNLRQDFELLTASLHHASHYLGQCLLIAYQVYRPATPGLWSDIHRLYDAAERKGLQSSIVKDPRQQHNQKTTIEAQYKRILLLALANPNHLPQADMALVYAQLEQWAPQCRLYPATHFDEPPSVCVVDLESDAPPSYLVYSTIPPSATCRLLDTTGLIDTLRGLLPQSPSEPPKQPPDPREQQAAVLWKPLLQRLLNAWGMTSKRRFARSKADTETVELVFGLSAAHQLLNNRSTMDADHTIGHSHPPAARIHEKATATKGPSAAKKVIIYSSAILNESADGSCLKWKAADTDKMRVAELLMIRHRHPGQPWVVAVIRWLKTLNDGTVEFGIQLIAPDAIPVAVRPYSEEKSAHDYLKGLFLPELKATRQPASLIVPAFLYRADDILSLEMDQQEHHLQLVKAMESNRVFSRFQFSPTTWSISEKTSPPTRARQADSLRSSRQ